MLTPAVMPQVYDCLQAECTRVRVDLIAIGGIEDHVHLLVRMPPTISVSYLVQQLKGVSSHMANHAIAKHSAFKWHGAYGAFAVSKRLVPQAHDYIANQEQRHRVGLVHTTLELGSENGRA